MRISTFFTAMVGLVSTMFTKNKSKMTKNATHSTGHYQYQPSESRSAAKIHHKHPSYSAKSERSRGITKTKRMQNKHRRMVA